MKTAVEWLGKELESYGDPGYCKIEWETLDLLIQQAKEIEKKQLLHFAKLYDDDLSEGKIRSREELYNETFKQQ